MKLIVTPVSAMAVCFVVEVYGGITVCAYDFF